MLSNMDLIYLKELLAENEVERPDLNTKKLSKELPEEYVVRLADKAIVFRDYIFTLEELYVSAIRTLELIARIAEGNVEDS
jgi:hypothetical protein